MTTWGNICRVCSSPADYHVFAKIPIYLHGSTNEFLNWQKPINLLLEETTGLKVATNDNLPQRICAPCISYLKHAVTFRDQVINNALSLKVATVYSSEQKPQNKNNAADVSTAPSTSTAHQHEDKESALITATDLSYIEERPLHNLRLNNSNQLDQQNKVHKKLLSHQQENSTAGYLGNYEQQLRYLNVLFDKDPNTGLRPKQRNSSGINIASAVETTKTMAPATGSGSGTGEEEYPTATTSSDDNEDMTINADKNYYNYREKNFEEDDIMDLDALRSAVTINIPESCKERKCRACSKRFMFEDSFTRHLNVCPEYHFLGFIEEVSRLLHIRRSKALSPHEYIRRMIFCVRKTCEWLRDNHVDESLLELLQQREVEKRQDKIIEESFHSKKDASSSILVSNDEIYLKSSCPSQKSDTQKLKAPLDSSTSEFTQKFLLTLPSENEVDPKVPFNTSTCMEEPQNVKQNESGLHNDYLMPLKKEIRLESLASDDDVDLKRLFYTPQQATHISGKSTPITVENNILYEIERSESRNSSATKQKSGACSELLKPIPLRSGSPSAERTNFLQKLQKALQPNSSKSISPTKGPLSFSARCNPCDLCFDSISDLELHNATKHNDIAEAAANTVAASPSQTVIDAKVLDERRRIIALFEDDI